MIYKTPFSDERSFFVIKIVMKNNLFANFSFCRKGHCLPKKKARNQVFRKCLSNL